MLIEVSSLVADRLHVQVSTTRFIRSSYLGHARTT